MNALAAQAGRADRAEPALRPVPQSRPRRIWAVVQRAGDRLSIYLPVILMGVLALLTYWLVRNTPIFSTPPGAPAPTREPDYTMQRFAVHHYDASGQLKGEVYGAEARHFPASDLMEISQVRLRQFDASGRVTVATADRGISNGDGSEVQLIGHARVDRVAPDGEPPLQFRGEFLHVFVRGEQLRSHKPVEVLRGNDRFTADAMEVDNKAQTLDLRGQVRVTLAPRAAGGGVVR